MAPMAKKFLIALAVVAVGQTLALASIVYGRMQLLKTGREIVLPVIPVDPRDIFRGDYVMLGYKLSPLNYSLSKDGALPKGMRRGGPIYVTIAPDGAGEWSVVRYAGSFPGDVKPEEAVLKGRITSIYGGDASGGWSIGVRYGIESYFVPEGTGKALQDAVREHHVATVVALGKDGTAAIKTLTIDGKRQPEAPFF